jgi:hypothetical protein
MASDKYWVTQLDEEAGRRRDQRSFHVFADPPSLTVSRARTLEQLAGFNPGVKRLTNPHQYPVGLERKLHGLKTALVLKARHLEPVRVAI